MKKLSIQLPRRFTAIPLQVCSTTFEIPHCVRNDEVQWLLRNRNNHHIIISPNRLITLTLLFLFCLLPSIVRAQTTFNITQEMSISQIQTELQMVINHNNTIFVTGSKTDADTTLVLVIDKEQTVVWKANYQSNNDFKANSLIFLPGEGTFEVSNGVLIAENAHAIEATGAGSTIIVSGNGKVQTSGDGMNAITTYGYVEIKDNAQLSSTTGETIESNNDNATVLVTGGTITATSENAIITRGKNALVRISGGYVSNDAVNINTVIYVKDETMNSQASVHVSGTGIVEAKGYGYAIFSNSRALISENAQVSNTNGGDENTAAIWASASISVTDNAKVSASKNNTILCSSSVIIDGNAIVEAKEDAIAIFVNRKTIEPVVVSGKARVIAENNYALSYNTIDLTVSGMGGVLFAYGNEFSDVIHSAIFANYPPYAPAGLGVVLAWDKDAGNINYDRFSADDIIIHPDTATAYWDIIDDKPGIYYANGKNTGFIPLEKVTVNNVGIEPITNEELRITVSPNPTTGELNVQSSRFKVQSVEIYDVFGRKVGNKFPSNVLKGWTAKPDGVVIEEGWTRSGRGGEEGEQPQADEWVINISHFSAGIYFLRVNDKTVKVVKY